VVNGRRVNDRNPCEQCDPLAVRRFLIGSHVTRPFFLGDVAIRDDGKSMTSSDQKRRCVGVGVWGRQRIVAPVSVSDPSRAYAGVYLPKQSHVPISVREGSRTGDFEE
jgi:hypothetical protein